MAHSGFVQNAIGLSARCPHCRAFAGVEGAKLNASNIGCQGHDAAQGIHLPHQVPFADSANRGVATHLPQGLYIVGQQQSLAAHARASQRSLGSGMATADYDDIKKLWVKHQGILPEGTKCWR